MTISIDQLTPEHQRVALEARAKIVAIITKCGLRQTVEVAPGVQSSADECDSPEQQRD